MNKKSRVREGTKLVYGSGSSVNEEVNISPLTYRGSIDINSDSVRDSVNTMLAGVTAKAFLTPYIAFERVRKVLAYFHIYAPGTTFLTGDHGVKTFPANQFDNITGMDDKGQVVSKLDSPFSIFFEYARNDEGLFDVFCEIVDAEDLHQLMADVAAETENRNPLHNRKEKFDEEELYEGRDRPARGERIERELDSQMDREEEGRGKNTREAKERTRYRSSHGGKLDPELRRGAEKKSYSKRFPTSLDEWNNDNQAPNQHLDYHGDLNSALAGVDAMVAMTKLPKAKRALIKYATDEDPPKAAANKNYKFDVVKGGLSEEVLRKLAKRAEYFSKEK